MWMEAQQQKTQLSLFIRTGQKNNPGLLFYFQTLYYTICPPVNWQTAHCIEMALNIERFWSPLLMKETARYSLHSQRLPGVSKNCQKTRLGERISKFDNKLTRYKLNVHTFQSKVLSTIIYFGCLRQAI